MTGLNRAGSWAPPTNVDARGCTVFKWVLTPSTMSGIVPCRLLPVLRTYVIYAEGRIERRIPAAITPGYEDRIAYVYVDNAGGRHALGEYRFREVQRYRPGDVPADGSAWIIDLGTVSQSWRSGTLQYGFSLATTRPFIGDVALASFLGALLEVGYTDVVCTGFSTHEGKTAGGSSSHVNGTNGDFRYLRNDGRTGPLHLAYEQARPELLDEARQKALIEALYRFGWKSMLSYRYERDGETRLLARTRHYRGHYHHLHLQGYEPDMETTNE